MFKAEDFTLKKQLLVIRVIINSELKQLLAFKLGYKAIITKASEVIKESLKVQLKWIFQIKVAIISLLIEETMEDKSVDMQIQHMLNLNERLIQDLKFECQKKESQKCVKFEQTAQKYEKEQKPYAQKIVSC